MEQLQGHKFIELVEKRPKTTFKDTLTYNQAKKVDSVGIIVEPPYVVFDIDDEYSFQLVHRLVEHTGVKTRVMKSSRGGHFWFKSDKPLTNYVDSNTALSVHVDVRSYGKHSQCMVKSAGLWRDWIQFDEEVDHVPFWLTPINHDKQFIGAKSGSRNDDLFSYIITLTNAGLNREQVRATIGLINDFIFSDKLTQDELAVITRDQAFENLHDSFFEGRRFRHDVFSQYMVNDNYIFRLNERLYMYHNGYYSDDMIHINRRMIDYVKGLTASQRLEVEKYMHLIADEPQDKSPYHIVTNNGLIDIRNSSELIPFTPEVFTTNKLNAYFDPTAYNKDVDNLFDKLTCYDKDLRLLLEEMVGYCLLPTAKFQKAFILTGGGSNGKSTFLDMLVDFLGNENVSSLSLKELNHNFKISEITSKLANIGDDISGEYMEDSSIFKKLVTGEDITVDIKNKDPYKLRNTAKLIFAANELPMTMDKSDGMGRRLMLVPFNAKFSPHDEDYDPFIIDKLRSENARSYLLNLGIRGAKRLFFNNGFTQPEVVDETIREYNIMNNNVTAFLETHRHIIEDMTTKNLYGIYERWCLEQGTSPYTMVKFNREIRNQTGFTTFSTTRGDEKVTLWTLKP